MLKGGQNTNTVSKIILKEQRNDKQIGIGNAEKLNIMEYLTKIGAK